MRSQRLVWLNSVGEHFGTDVPHELGQLSMLLEYLKGLFIEVYATSDLERGYLIVFDHSTQLGGWRKGLRQISLGHKA